MSRTAWKVSAIGGGLLMLGPVFGLLATMIGLALSFHAVSDVDPSQKASTLAQGISVSMWGTAIGLAIFPLGAILFGVSLWQLLRKRDS